VPVADDKRLVTTNPPAPQEPEPGEEARMSFTEHLAELRVRIIYSAWALVGSVLLCYLASDYLMRALMRPLKPLEAEGPMWTVLSPLEIVFVKIRIAGYGGLILALPFLVWQVCAFVFPGLRPSERRVMQILIAGCSVLASAGVAVAYFGVFPFLLTWLMNWVPEGIVTQLRVNETLNIIIKGLIAFAIAFQFPMAVLILVYMGLLTPDTLRAYRKIAIVGLAVMAAVFTPPDPVSMCIMLVPLWMLYELSILVSHVVYRRRLRADAAE
jgi:sec-independent protein translocase protein TatC